MEAQQYMILAPWHGRPAGEKTSREVAAGEIVRLTASQAADLGPRLVELYTPEQIPPKRKPRKRKTRPAKPKETAEK